MELILDNISFSYPKKQILNQVSATIPSGHLVALLGVNGAGKSTLLKLIARLLTPKSGQILFGNPLNCPILALSSREMAQHCAYVAQSSHAPALAVFDYVLLGRIPYQKGLSASASCEDLDCVSRCLAGVGLLEKSDIPMSRLSGGQMQNAVIARALAQQPSILLLDEPTNNLDPRHQMSLMQHLSELSHNQNTTIIFSMHDINLALNWADQAMLLHNQTIMTQSPVGELTEQQLSMLFDLDYSAHQLTNKQRIFWPTCGSEKQDRSQRPHV